MRPLAVLILIAGAVLALVFAFLNTTGGTTKAADTARPPGAVRPASSEGGASPLSVPERIADPAVPLETASRTTVSGAVEQSGWANQLVGRVTSAEGQPVIEATVNLMINSETTQIAELSQVVNDGNLARAKMRVKTDLDGYFRFESIRPGDDYALSIIHRDFARTYHGPVVVPETGTIEENVEMSRGFQLKGYVRDKETGMPIANAEVSLDDPIFALMPSNRKRKSPRLRVVLSDESGYYFFSNISPGNKVLGCKVQGYGMLMLSNLQFIGEEPDVQEKDLLLEPAEMIAGSVVGPNGEGIAGAKIVAMSNQDGRASQGTTLSKSNGEFVIEDLSKGVFVIKTEMQGWDADIIPRVDAGTTDLIIEAFAKGSISGRVFERDGGEPVTSFTITVRNSHPTHVAYGRPVTTKKFNGRGDGTFQVEGISEGNYVVQASAPNFAHSFSERVQVKQGETTPGVEVPLGVGGTLSGQVVDAYSREPIVGAEVQTLENNWIDSDFTRMLGAGSHIALTTTTVKTDSEGRYTIKLMTRGDYQIRVRHPDYYQVITNDVRMNEGRKTEMARVELSKGGVVAGTVYASDGSRARGIDVFLRPVDGDFGRHMQARTDAQGRYRLPNCAPGSYKLSAARPPGNRADGPFAAIVDMKNSETKLTVADGREYTQDLYMGKN